ncbi:membrane protein insertase YidC [Candidatus Collierbacteria bacterium]|nr:membrane protein insertase YidC [Candidatus Collierbacteria bacterium]
MFNTYLYQPILQSLIFFYHLLGDSFGWAIIGMTFVIRLLSAPLTIPAMRVQQKLQKLHPELEKLKKTHTDKKELQKAQLELYRQHGVNPGAGCLPQIVQIVILIALYQVFMKFLNGGMVDGQAVNMNFWWLDLSKPDKYYILPFLAGTTQLVFSMMLKPGTEHHEESRKIVERKEESRGTGSGSAGKTEMDMATEIQNQMLFMMPLMTTIISLKFPSGLALYWVMTTVFSIIQQWIMTGPGGLRYFFKKALDIIGIWKK